MPRPRTAVIAFCFALVAILPPQPVEAAGKIDTPDGFREAYGSPGNRVADVYLDLELRFERQVFRDDWVPIQSVHYYASDGGRLARYDLIFNPATHVGDNNIHAASVAGDDYVFSVAAPDKGSFAIKNRRRPRPDDPLPVRSSKFLRWALPATLPYACRGHAFADLIEDPSFRIDAARSLAVDGEEVVRIVWRWQGENRLYQGKSLAGETDFLPNRGWVVRRGRWSDRPSIDWEMYSVAYDDAEVNGVPIVSESDYYLQPVDSGKKIAWDRWNRTAFETSPDLTLFTPQAFGLPPFEEPVDNGWWWLAAAVIAVAAAGALFWRRRQI